MAVIKILGIDSTTGRRKVGGSGDTTIPSGGSGASWGQITGTIGDQTDLSNNLNGKMATTCFSGLGKITVGTTAPQSPSTGDLWIDTN